MANKIDLDVIGILSSSDDEDFAPPGCKMEISDSESENMHNLMSNDTDPIFDILKEKEEIAQKWAEFEETKKVEKRKLDVKVEEYNSLKKQFDEISISHFDLNVKNGILIRENEKLRKDISDSKDPIHDILKEKEEIARQRAELEEMKKFENRMLDNYIEDYNSLKKQFDEISTSDFDSRVKNGILTDENNKLKNENQNLLTINGMYKDLLQTVYNLEEKILKGMERSKKRIDMHEENLQNLI